MINRESAADGLKNLAELVESQNWDQFLLQGESLLPDIERASGPIQSNYKTGTRSAPPLVYGPDHDRYREAGCHLREAMRRAKAKDKVAVLKSIDSARQELESSKT
jgi:hypothetical protein